MGVLIGLFIAGYIGYAIAFSSVHKSGYDLIVPAVFFLGAIFVWLSISFALLTVLDLRRVELLEHETVIDPLIGIYNRRYLDRRLKEEVSRSQRYSTRLSVLMLDIDHFKRINDTYGHKAGDLVLHHVGRLVLSTLRAADIATRYGGEELLVVAPNTSITEAITLAERIRQYIETHPLMLETENRKRQEVGVTVSIGVAEITQETANGDALICNADEALYRAKQKGRNRVESHSGVRQKMVA
jgi:diguanylate cyclase (GGDEF)-like protein